MAGQSIAQQNSDYNVLFIAIDDLNDYVGFLEGHPQAITPNFDRLAAESAIFTNAQCPAPKCAPSRAALMTGVYPHEEYVPVPLHFRDVPALEDKISLAQHFKENGYFTMSIGKIFHGWNASKADNPYSWNVHQQLSGNLTGYLNSGNFSLAINNSMVYDDPCMSANNYDVPALGPLDIATEDYVETHTARWVAEQIDESYDQPFFIGCGFFKPHIPNYAPKEWFDLYEDSIIEPLSPLLSDFDDIPDYAQNFAFTTQYDRYAACEITDEIVLAYLANISYVDHCLGIVLDALDRSKHKDNTIVVLWSDHGHHQGEKLHFSKNTLWEESARVPFLIKIPRYTKEAQRISSPVNLMDIYPTLIDFCDLPEIEIAGRSLLPLMDDGRNTWDYPSITTLDTFNHSIRTEQFRFTQYKDNSIELYDHENDGNEEINLANHPDYQNEQNVLSEQLDDILSGGNGLLNEIPRVKWIVPSKGNAIHTSSNPIFLNIPLEVDAYDIDGEIERVEFWINDEKVATLNEQPYQFIWSPPDSGFYLLKSVVIDNDGRETWSSDNSTYINFTNGPIYDIGVASFSYFPNPTRRDLNVYFYEHGSEPLLVQVFDTSGILVQEWLTYESLNTFDISSLIKGIYLLNIRNSKGWDKSEKLVIFD